MGRFTAPHAISCSLEGSLHQEPIVRGASGVLTGQAGQRATFGDQALAALHSFFIERRVTEVRSKPGARDDV